MGSGMGTQDLEVSAEFMLYSPTPAYSLDSEANVQGSWGPPGL